MAGQDFLAVGICDSIRVCDLRRGGGLMSLTLCNASLTEKFELAGVPDLGVGVLLPPLARWDGGPLPESIEEGGGIAPSG